jgi:prevent-host-death family protein
MNGRTGLAAVSDLCRRRQHAVANAEGYDYNDQYDYNGKEVRAMSESSWTVAEAKAKLSEVIEKAQTSGPQRITRHGKEAVVVVSAEEWERKTKRKGNLAEFFAASPLRGSGLQIERLEDRPRKIDL